jgi:hypothetical protein
MKKILPLLCLAALLPLPLAAQSYAPTTAWPFLYEDFRAGTVSFADSGASRNQLLNIHLLNATLWHRDGDDLLLSDPRGVTRIVLDADTFIYMDGALVRLIRSRGEARLVVLVKGDYNALVAPPAGAYGMSAQSSSVTNRTGIGQINYTQSRIERTDDRPLPLVREYYFLSGDKIIRATRRELEKALPASSLPALRSYIKARKINWTDEASLSQLLDLIDN